MTDKWIKDTGLVWALLFLVLGITYGKIFFIISIALLLASILVSRALYPLAFVWLKFAEALNLIIPKIFFGIIFFVIIFPIGVFRRITKGDALLIVSWREVKTALVERNHIFSKKDLEAPY